MKTLFKILFLVTGLVMLVAVFGTVFGGWALWHHAGPDMHIVVNDEELFLGSSDFGDWLGVGIGLMVAGVACLFALLLVLLLGVALPLLIVGGVVAALLAGLLGVGAVLGSPLILLGLLLFVVLRNRSRAQAAPSRPA